MHTVQPSSTELLPLALPNIILQKDLIWKSQHKLFCHIINVFFQNLNEIKKGYLCVPHAHSIYYAR